QGVACGGIFPCPVSRLFPSRVKEVRRGEAALAQAYDVVIVGGGAAGLSAALVVGGCRRTVVVCDDGHPRNAASLAAHCLLGNEGIAHSKLLAKGRQELSEYEGVVYHNDLVDSITKGNQNECTVLCEKGLTATARKVLLTTGLKDEVPKVDGIEGLYGRSVHQCPYCDGFENRDKPIGVYGKGDK